MYKSQLLVLLVASCLLSTRVFSPWVTFISYKLVLERSFFITQISTDDFLNLNFIFLWSHRSEFQSLDIFVWIFCFYHKFDTLETRLPTFSVLLQTESPSQYPHFQQWHLHFTCSLGFYCGIFLERPSPTTSSTLLYPIPCLIFLHSAQYLTLY